jgi:hypothetical protein
MRRFCTAALLLTFLTQAGPAAAENAFTEWADSAGNTFLTGLNGFITAPADPAMETWTVSEEYEELPVSEVSGRFFGFFMGTFLGLYRGTTGLFDMLFAPLPMVTLSPEPRYNLIPGFEYDE